MTILENVLEDNKKFVENFEGSEMSHHAQKKLAILTCMDCRLIDFFEPALGLERGDAKIVRNAGNSIVGEDAIRSIGAALYNLGAEEVLVVGHTECGMAGADAEALKEKMLARGIAEEDIAKYDLAERFSVITSSNCVAVVVSNLPLTERITSFSFTVLVIFIFFISF